MGIRTPSIIEGSNSDGWAHTLSFHHMPMILLAFNQPRRRPRHRLDLHTPFHHHLLMSQNLGFSLPRRELGRFPAGEEVHELVDGAAPLIYCGRSRK